MPDLDRLDWTALDRLRALFLARSAAGPYWRDQGALAAYDATYAERIGWKWDALLRELKLRGWAPPAGSVLVDYGCGSGMAGRRVLAAWGAGHFSAAAVHDHAPEAVEFALGRLRADHAGLPARAFAPADAERPFTLVVSHVVNELDAAGRAELEALAARAAAVLWVEPGTHADSRLLAAARDRLRAAHRIVAPCTHREACPLFAAGGERDWCHFFAEPPPGVQASSDWVRFAQRAGVDLRSQAYACLVLEALALTPSAGGEPPAAPAPLRAARALGRPEVFKPYARLLACDATGLHWLELPKRAEPALVKRLGKHPPAAALYGLAHDGRHITSATVLTDPPACAPGADLTDS